MYTASELRKLGIEAPEGTTARKLHGVYHLSDGRVVQTTRVERKWVTL